MLQWLAFTSQNKGYGPEHPSQLRPFFIEPLCLCGFCSGSSPHFKEMLVRSVMDSEDKSIAVDYGA